MLYSRLTVNHVMISLRSRNDRAQGLINEQQFSRVDS